MSTNTAHRNVRKLRRPEGAGTLTGRRLRANWPGELRVDGLKLKCTVMDVSTSGAQLRTETALPTSAQLCLVLEKFGPIRAAVAWQERDRVGLHFSEDQEWVFQICKQRFDPAAWLKTN